MPPRTNVISGSASNAVVAHAEVCTPLDAWMSRAIASTRPPSTVRVARRRADAVARQYSSILATFQFRTIHFSLFTKSAMVRRSNNNIRISLSLLSTTPRFRTLSTLSTFQFRTRTIHYPLLLNPRWSVVVIIISAPGFHYCPLHVSVLYPHYPPFDSTLALSTFHFH